MSDDLSHMTNALFSRFLGLEAPWYLIALDMDKNVNGEFEIHLEVRVQKQAIFPCPHCGQPTTRRGYENIPRKWRHTDWLPAKTYIHCARPKVCCPTHGIVQINAPFERQNSRYTLLFEGIAVHLMRHMPISRAAETLRCDEKTLASILHYWVDAAKKKVNLKDVKSIAVDETSNKRGHNYVTVVIDADERSVIDVQPGKDSSTIDNFSTKLLEQGGDPENITSVTSDMSSAFLSAVKKNFPNSETVIDKFHVKSVLLKGLDEVRKQEQSTASDKKLIFRGRRLFWIPKSKQTDDQTAKIASLSKQFPKTGRAYRMICAFDDFYSKDTREEAELAFDALVRWGMRSRL